MSITKFSGPHRFLSNFHVHTVHFEGVAYRTVEHAYVAAKTTDEAMRERVRAIIEPGDVKRFGREHVVLRPGWNKMRIPVMENLVRQKFDDAKLLTMLLETSPHELIEGNPWGDTFWGQSPIGNGENNLGKILMDIRDDPLNIFG